MFDLTPVPKVITFDCYGTLVQWREVLLRELGDILKAEGRDPGEAVALLDTFSEISHVLTHQKTHRLNKEILRVGFRGALERHGLQATNERLEKIAQSVPTMGLHPEVPEVRRKLRTRYKRAIFEHAHRAMGVKKEETVHVPMSMVLDMQACHELGIRGIRINRPGERGNPDWLPYVELPDLTGVPGLLLPNGERRSQA